MRPDNMLHVLRRILLTCTNAKLSSCIGTPEGEAITAPDNMLHLRRRARLAVFLVFIATSALEYFRKAGRATAKQAGISANESDRTTSARTGSWCPSVLVFPEIELPHPHPQKDKAYPAHDELPIRVRLVDRVHPEAHHRSSEKDDTDNLIWFHVSAELLPA
jgi:hypothetical protein